MRQNSSEVPEAEVWRVKYNMNCIWSEPEHQEAWVANRLAQHTTAVMLFKNYQGQFLTGPAAT